MAEAHPSLQRPGCKAQEGSPVGPSEAGPPAQGVRVKWELPQPDQSLLLDTPCGSSGVSRPPLTQRAILSHKPLLNGPCAAVLTVCSLSDSHLSSHLQGRTCSLPLPASGGSGRSLACGCITRLCRRGHMAFSSSVQLHLLLPPFLKGTCDLI